ncbi:hypothetical protein Tco_0625035 [Tanacetum coccineum]|uniref:Reverse transcriptase domain-containing protein n=1 Tax=Tanacetum coccineum TaxID=301880 RepID=A0ABQ4WFN7_9ASTR
MRTRSSSKFVSESSTNPPSTSTNTKRRNRRRSKQRVEPFALEEIPRVLLPMATLFSGYHDNIQGYVLAASTNYNQGNTGYRPQSVANQIRPPGFAQPNVQNNQPRYNQGYNQDRGNYQGNTSYQVPIQTPQVATSSGFEKLKKINEVNIKAMQTQINNVNNELRNEMQSSIQDSMSNQTNELKNMMASFFQMNIPSTSGSGSLPSNTVANPKGELKAITTRSGLALDGPSVPMPFPFINPEEDERKEETLTDPKHGEFTIKVSPPPVQKAKPPSQRNFVVHKRDPRHPHIPYHIHKFWQMFKQLHVNISLANALILISKYQKILKILLSNKEKLLEMANTPLSENCSAVILKKLPEKLGDPGKFLISCGFSELKCKALANLVHIPADFVIVDYESDPRVPLILGRLFLQTARALIDVHREEMILRDNDIFDPEGGIFLIEKLLNLDSTKDLPFSPLSGSTTSSSSLTTSEISDYSLEEFPDELALIVSFPPGNDDMTPEDVIREIEYLLNHNQIAKYSPNNDLVDNLPEMFIDEHTLDYSSPPLWDDNDDELFDLENINDDVYDDPFDTKEEKNQRV